MAVEWCKPCKDRGKLSAAATYCDAVLSGGQKRFSDGGVVFLNDSDTARASSEISRRSEWRRDADGDAGIVRLDLGHAAAGEKSGAAESAR